MIQSLYVVVVIFSLSESTWESDESAGVFLFSTDIHLWDRIYYSGRKLLNCKVDTK